MELQEIQPCPVCNSKAEAYSNSFREHKVRCGNRDVKECGLSQKYIYPSKKSAIEHWNNLTSHKPRKLS